MKLLSFLRKESDPQLEFIASPQLFERLRDTDYTQLDQVIREPAPVYRPSRSAQKRRLAPVWLLRN